MSANGTQTLQDAVAIVGLSGRFPRSESVVRFWDNLCEGGECISVFTPEELEEEGISAREYGRKEYVPARGILGDISSFDAGLFGYTPREAQLIDPQQRLFLECAWEAMEKAGYCSARFQGAIGCFGGVGLNTYLPRFPAGAVVHRVGSDPVGGRSPLPGVVEVQARYGDCLLYTSPSPRDS